MEHCPARRLHGSITHGGARLLHRESKGLVTYHVVPNLFHPTMVPTTTQCTPDAGGSLADWRVFFAWWQGQALSNCLQTALQNFVLDNTNQDKRLRLGVSQEETLCLFMI